MNASLSWIKAYVPDLETTDQEFFDAMTLSGTKGESYTRLDKNLEKIVVGQLKSIEPHPDADKLVICQVDIGTETIQIVTGASNMKVGDSIKVKDLTLASDKDVDIMTDPETTVVTLQYVHNSTPDDDADAESAEAAE